MFDEQHLMQWATVAEQVVGETVGFSYRHIFLSSFCSTVRHASPASKELSPRNEMLNVCTIFVFFSLFLRTFFSIENDVFFFAVTVIAQRIWRWILCQDGVRRGDGASISWQIIKF